MTTARWFFLAFCLLYAAAVTWPVMGLFNRIEPYIFGLPFSLVWVAFWVAMGGVALYLLDRSEQRHMDDKRAGR